MIFNGTSTCLILFHVYRLVNCIYCTSIFFFCVVFLQGFKHGINYCQHLQITFKLIYLTHRRDRKMNYHFRSEWIWEYSSLSKVPKLKTFYQLHFPVILKDLKVGASHFSKGRELANTKPRRHDAVQLSHYIFIKTKRLWWLFMMGNLFKLIIIHTHTHTHIYIYIYIYIW